MGTAVAFDTAPTSCPDTAAGVLAAARERRRTADRAEAELLGLAVDWAVIHPAESIHQPATHVLAGFGQTDLALAGPGAPTVAEYAVPELAAALGHSSEAGKRYLGEALELRYRLPRLWARVQAGDLPAWKARLVARHTITVSLQAAGWVDRQVAAVAGRVKPARLDPAGGRGDREVHARRGAAAGRRVVGQAARHRARPAGLVHRDHAPGRRARHRRR